jgi:hypothetical protein
MTWSNPPDAVDALSTMLLACSSFTGAGFTSANIHYPAAAIEVDDGGGSKDALPICLLAETTNSRTPYAEIGVAGLPSGELTAVLYVDTDAGTLEKLARAICKELGTVVGLPNLNASAGMCSNPTKGARAADADDHAQASHRAIEITITYGLR